LKIVDFGLSNLYEKGEKLGTACGSPCYASPEMVKGKTYDGLKSDIWSSGVVLYAMLCGFLPFEDDRTSMLEMKIIEAKFELPAHLSMECRDLLGKILNPDPEERFTIEEIR
jgi:5'-AMP-activated protein kinase catalytic alpha subunit